MQIDEHIFALYTQSNELRTHIIQNIDNQVVHLRQVFAGILTALIGVSFSVERYSLLLLGVIVTGVFWLIEGSVKCNQRGYVLTASEMQRKMVNTKTEEEIADIIKTYHSDMNGYFSLRERDTHWYDQKTGLIHTMLMKNVCLFYMGVALVLIIIFCVLKAQS